MAERNLVSRTVSRSGFVLITVAVILASHFHVQATGAGYQGPLVIFDRIYDVVCAAALLVLASALGQLLLERVSLPDASATEQLLFATALGIGCEGTGVLFLGAVSLLNGWMLATLFLLTAWVSKEQLVRIPERFGRIVSELEGSIGGWLAVVLGVVVGFLLLESAAPPTDWDTLTYHLDVPREYLDAGRIFLPVDNHHAAFVGLQHMLYIPLLAVGAESAPAVLSALVAVLLGLSMYVVGHRLFDETTGRLAAALLWGSPVVVLVAVTARVDVTMTWLLVLVHFALVVSLARREIDGWFWVAAGIAGLAVATKYSAVAYLAALSPLVLWAVVATFRENSQRSWTLIGFGAVAGLVAAPWLLKNVLLLGAPFYPYLAEIQLEPWLADYTGTSGIPPSVDPSAFRLPRQIREPFSLVALFVNPASMTEEREGWFYFGNLVLLLLPLSVLWSRRTNLLLLAPPLLYVGFVLYPDGYINLRYLVPALVVATLVASHVVMCAGRATFSAVGLRRVFWGSTVFLCLILTAGAMYQKLEEMRPYEYWLGVVSEREYLADNDNPDVFLNFQVREGLNEMLSEDHRVVMLFESRGYGYRPAVLQDNLGTTWRVLAPHEPWRDCMRPTGATHVLVNYGHFGIRVGRGMERTAAGWDSFPRFARRCLDRVAILANSVLYRIEPQRQDLLK